MNTHNCGYFPEYYKYIIYEKKDICYPTKEDGIIKFPERTISIDNMKTIVNAISHYLKFLWKDIIHIIIHSDKSFLFRRIFTFDDANNFIISDTTVALAEYCTNDYIINLVLVKDIKNMMVYVVDPSGFSITDDFEIAHPETIHPWIIKYIPISYNNVYPVRGHIAQYIYPIFCYTLSKAIELSYCYEANKSINIATPFPEWCAIVANKFDIKYIPDEIIQILRNNFLLLILVFKKLGLKFDRYLLKVIWEYYIY